MIKKLSIVFVFLFSIFIFNGQADAASSQLIIINKKTNTLAFYNAGKLVKTFSVGTGRSRDLTPEGTFRIVNKIKNRPYYTKNIPGGDPRNPLGDRWMGLEARGTYGTTYGIHGNANESSIGKYVSSGCVRMHNTEVRWLFDQVQLYTPVIITYSSSSFDAIAKANGFPVNTDGWVLSGGKWYYYVKGAAQKGWQNISSKWYYFDGSGVMKTGWLSYNSQWYYLDKSGAMKTGWVSDKAKWYYLDKSGVLQTGWLSYGGKKYFLEQSGAMKTGWLLSGKDWYYFMPDGSMRTGWGLVKGTWYYFEGSGIMKTGWLDLSGQKYFLNSDGGMVKGWKEIEGKWYYFNKDGLMAANTSVDGYKLGADGAWIQVEYVALGDSLAAGMTPQGVDRPVANGVDPDWGYPNYIAENFGKTYQLLDFDNFGVSGYTTDNVITQLSNPDVQKEIKEATHVTLDIGANDLLAALPAIQADPTKAPAAIGTVAAKINAILGTIDQLNPNVKVYVMGYYNPFPYETDPIKTAQLNQLLTAFNGQIQAQASAHSDTFVPTAQVINVANFAEYITNPTNIHLSLAGYQVVAGEFWKAID